MAVELKLDAAVEFTAAADADQTPPTFSVVAYDGGKFRPSNWPETVVDLSGLTLEAGSRPVLLDHDNQQRVGHTTDVSITDREIRVDGMLSGTGHAAQEVLTAARNGFPWRASIGLRVATKDEIAEGKRSRINRRLIAGPVVVARQSVLQEISFVAVAADNDAVVDIAATQGKEKADMTSAESRKFNQWLKANDWTKDELSETQLETLEAAWRAELEPSIDPEPTSEEPDKEPLEAGDKADPIADLRAQQAAEISRVNEIRKLFAGDEPELELKAVSDGWDMTRAELELLRAQRTNAPAIHTKSSGDSPSGDVLEAACCVSGGLRDIEEHFSDKTLQAAHDRFRRGIGLQDLLLEAAWSNGYTGRRFREDHAGVLRAAFSTTTLPGILGNNANKFLLEGFEHVEQAWKEIAATRPVSDFKTNTSYRLTGDMQFIQVGPDGEIKHGAASEDSYTNQAKTYARMFSITRTDQINDDLGALTAVPRRIGRGAGLKLNDVFWTEFMDNATFFAAGNSNYISGATTTLTSTGLTTGVLTFRKQTDQDGKPLGVDPRILLVPPDLEVAADELYVSTNITTGGGSSKDKQPSRNVFVNKYRPVVSTYLSNTSYTGYSTTAWYLLADPMDLATIEVVFLNGQQTPTVESADADFNTLGIQIRGYFDFGVNKQEERGGLKSKGAA